MFGKHLLRQDLYEVCTPEEQTVSMNCQCILGVNMLCEIQTIYAGKAENTSKNDNLFSLP